MSFVAELKRRNVIRVAVAYVIVAWVIAQVAEFAFENFGAPDWVLKSVVVVLLLGLPLALIFAWAFELTPEGLKREKEVDRTRSIVSETGRKLDRIIIGVLVVALAWFAWDKFYVRSEPEPATETTAGDSAAPAPEDRSVAVLPFVAMSSGPDDEFFADGLTEEILNSLSQLPELLVTARTSAFSFKGQDVPVQEIAQALGVQHIVEGSVRRSGDRLRVTAQLIRAQDGFHLWSENYDSHSTDAISVQENIAEQIAAALDVVLDEKKREAMKLAGLRDVEAFTLYQKGLRVYELAHGEMENTNEGLRQANGYFDQVIARVPNFSQVYIDHSDLYVHLLADDAAGSIQPPMSAAEVSANYDAMLADYRAASRGTLTPEMRLLTEVDLAFVSGNWRGLASRTERALSQPGCLDGNWTVMVSNSFGFAEQYLQRSYRVLACDPRRSLSWFNSARAALRSGDAVEALRLAREGSEIAPGSWLSTELVRTLAALGRHAEAREEIDTRLSDPIFSALFRTLVAAHEGDPAQFERARLAFLEVNDSANYLIAVTSAWGGMREQANQAAATIDRHTLGPVTLTQMILWCGCGAPFDLEVTPNFAAHLEGSGLHWPPPGMSFPLKDW